MGERTACNGEHWFTYRPAINEEGWHCALCDHRPGEPPGYAPELDRDAIHRKVYALLTHLHEQRLVYVSNGTEGDGIIAAVADRCVAAGRYDQGTILLFLLEAMTPDGAAYWQRIGDGIRAGNDPRERCPCGKLSTLSVYAPDGWAHYCSNECRDRAGTGPAAGEGP